MHQALFCPPTQTVICAVNLFLSNIPFLPDHWPHTPISHKDTSISKRPPQTPTLWISKHPPSDTHTATTNKCTPVNSTWVYPLLASFATPPLLTNRQVHFILTTQDLYHTAPLTDSTFSLSHMQWPKLHLCCPHHLHIKQQYNVSLQMCLQHTRCKWIQIYAQCHW